MVKLCHFRDRLKTFCSIDTVVECHAGLTGDVVEAELPPICNINRSIIGNPVEVEVSLMHHGSRGLNENLVKRQVLIPRTLAPNRIRPVEGSRNLPGSTCSALVACTSELPLPC